MLQSRPARFGMVAAAIAAILASLVVAPNSAQAAAGDRLFWVGSTATPNVADGLFAATASAVSTATNLNSQVGLRRALATDGTYLYFSDGSNLVRTGLDGTGKTTVVAGVTAPQQIAVSGQYLYYADWSNGIYGVDVTSVPSTAQLIVSVAGITYGWSGVAVSGTTIYAMVNYGSSTLGTQGLYSATLNSLSAVTATMIDSTAKTTYSASTLSVDAAGNLYASGSVASIPVRSASGTWSTINVSSATSSTIYFTTVLGSTVYFSAASNSIGSVETSGTGATSLSAASQFTSTWGVAAAPAPTYTVIYDGNGETSGDVPIDGSSPYASGSTVTLLPNSGNLAKTGYQFWQWMDAPTQAGSSMFKSPGQTFTVTSNTTLYARWGGGPLEFRTSPAGQATSSIPFPNTPSGQASTLTVYVRNVGAIGVDVSNVTGNGSGVSRTGGTCSSSGGTILPYNAGAVADCTYTFAWSSSGSSLSYPFAVNYFTSNSVTLTGTALPNYTVTYNGNGSTAGTVPVDGSSPYTSGSSATVLGNIGNLAQPGFTFSGWNSAANGSGTPYAAGATFVPGVNTVLYAQWTANGGGGSGGGGGPASTDPVTTPTPSASATTVVTLAQPGSLGPVQSPALTSLRPGGSVVLVGGEPGLASSSRNRPGGSVTTSGDGWSVTTSGRTPSGSVQSLSPVGGVQVPQGGSVRVSGSGYQPGTPVQIYGLNPGTLLGGFKVDASGKFAGTVALPATMSPGMAVLQVNGYTPTATVRSLSLGIEVINVSESAVRKASTSVYFAEGSSRLDTQAQRTLAAFVKSLPRVALSVSVVSTGYVQGTRDTSNDFTLSTDRATKVADQLKADRLRGRYFVTGRGVAKEQGAKARKVIVTVSYRTR